MGLFDFFKPKKTALEWAKEGESYRLSKDFAKAINCFDKALELDSGLARAWLSKGLALGMMGKEKDALDSIQKAARMGDQKAMQFLQNGSL